MLSVLYVMEKLTSENERSTFEKMCFIINAVKEQRRKHPHRGNNPKLRTEDQLLMMLMYTGSTVHLCILQWTMVLVNHNAGI